MTPDPTPIRLSVVIPAYKARSWIAGCLDSHKAQEVTEGVEWIVVDSGADGTVEWIAQHHPWVRIIESETRLNVSKGRNRGVAMAQGTWIAFTDVDVRVPPGWTRAILRHTQQGHDYFGGTVLNGTPESPTGTADYFLCFSEYIPFKGRRDGRSYQVGANLVISKRLWDRVGAMEESMMFGEDSEYGLRCVEAGATAALFSDMPVTHINRTDPEVFLANQRRYGLGAAETRLASPLRGSFLVRHPHFIFFLPFYRAGVCLTRILRDNRLLLIPWLRFFPEYLRGLKAYTGAFAQRAKSAQGDQS